MNLVIMQCVHICSKFSVKCGASHKNNRKSRLFNAYHLQIGRICTYRQVLHLTITVFRKLHDIILSFRQYFVHLTEGPSRIRSVDKLQFSVDWSSQVEQYLNSVAVMATT